VTGNLPAVHARYRDWIQRGFGPSPGLGAPNVHRLARLGRLSVVLAPGGPRPAP
jgi:hypothetical protein